MKSELRDDKVEINASSMADIAFLLLIFFLVATTLVSQKGIGIQLPPDVEDQYPVEINQRNLFKVLINSQDRIMVQNKEINSLKTIRNEVKEFILNEGHDERLSENPKKAVISIKTSRKTKYGTFIRVLDELKGAYYEIYAKRVGLTEEEFRKLKLSIPEEKELYEKGKEGIPMNISIVEPSN